MSNVGGILGMLTLSFTAFLKIASLPTEKKFRELAKYSSPGGYDFYKGFKKLGPKLVAGEITLAEAQSELAVLSREAERKHNFQALNVIHKWHSKNNYPTFQPPRGYASIKGSNIRIRLEPEFGYVSGENRYVVHAWNTAKPELSKAAAGVGIYALNQHLKQQGFSDCKFQIFDTRKNRLLSENIIPNNASIILAHDLMSLSNLWAEIESSDAA